MKDIGIVTIIDNNNYGNRLQNYAVQMQLQKTANNAITIKNEALLNKKSAFFEYIIRNIKSILLKTKIYKKTERKKDFLEFNKNINFSKHNFNWFHKNIYKKYDFFIVGSDQVWNPKIGRLREFELLQFTGKTKKISFAASFGISDLPEQYKEKTAKALKDFKAISVREDTGKRIVENLTGREDVEVLVDPTMLLTAKEWDKVAKKPEQLKTDRYILNYFLGELSENRKKEIERVAKENHCEIINILDKNSPFYQTGPSEFLYLEKNAFLICTDSFHSSVFAILYNRPFLVFDREDNLAKMNSRIETLLSKFKLEDRKYKGKITQEMLDVDYKEAYEILKKEREKANNFLKKALN